MRTEDITYSLSIQKMRPDWSQEWSYLLLTAPIIGTDGIIREETHTVIFGIIKISPKYVKLRWVINSVWREDKVPNDSRFCRDITVPKDAVESTAYKNLTLIGDRLGFLIAPQHIRMFHGEEARKFCERVHSLITVNEIMNG